MCDPYEKTTPHFRVTLACGCRIATRDKPTHPHQKFACRNNLGHGYRLPWTRSADTATGYTVTNPETTP